MIRVKIQADDFTIDAETAWLANQSKSVGGINTFTGYVRDLNDDEVVSLLFLEHYPGMTEKQITEIIEEAFAKWRLIAATVIHRVGELQPGDQIVFIGVASMHRGDAFAACEYIIDYLKTRATFWKREITQDGERWLAPRQSDLEAADKWRES